jgi:hypothetical protein
VINADALHNGDGGRVIVWADDTTGFYGNLSNRGGANSGNGGFTEISGKENLVFDGKVNSSAPFGTNGTILFDPANIRVVAGTGANDEPLADGQILLEMGVQKTSSLAQRRYRGLLATFSSKPLTISPLTLVYPLTFVPPGGPPGAPPCPRRSSLLRTLMGLGVGIFGWIKPNPSQRWGEASQFWE